MKTPGHLTYYTAMKFVPWKIFLDLSCLSSTIESSFRPSQNGNILCSPEFNLRVAQDHCFKNSLIHVQQTLKHQFRSTFAYAIKTIKTYLNG